MRRRIFAKNEKTVSASDAARLKKEKARERERASERESFIRGEGGGERGERERE